MPLLDVAFLTSDPEFATTFVVIRATKTVGSNGRTQLTPQTIPGVVGSVQPAGSLDLQRLPEGSNLRGAVAIWTSFILTDGQLSEDLTADQVDWNGHLYTVLSVEDFTQFGQGFVKAVCQLATNKARTDGR